MQNVLVGHSHYMSFNVNKHLWLYSAAALLKKISPYSGCGNRNTFHLGPTIKLSVKLNVNENQKALPAAFTTKSSKCNDLFDLR